MRNICILILCAIFTLAHTSLSAEEEFALFAIHPNSQAFEFEDSDKFDKSIEGYRKMQRRNGQVLYVSAQPHFRLTSVKSATVVSSSAGSMSVMIEFTDDFANALRGLRLNRITHRFALLHSSQEVIGEISTVSIGVDTRRFGIPVTNIKEAESIIKLVQPLVTNPQSKEKQ